jgi:hypothetical protein
MERIPSLFLLWPHFFHLVRDTHCVFLSHHRVEKAAGYAVFVCYAPIMNQKASHHAT